MFKLTSRQYQLVYKIMREQRICVDPTLEPDFRLSLPLSATHHISNVLRKRIGQHKVKLLLHPDASRGLSSIEITDQSLSILSGAQGGFSEIEVESALASDYMAIEPGPGVLRTETAAIAAISICQSRWGDMG